jgi:cellulose synthase/poly-beta-1,6-N-acetylglucosamine synthase-like glycosyltransferase
MARNSIFLSKTPIEVIYVVEKNLTNVFNNLKKSEKIIKIENIGRGFMQAEGVRNSSGDIILFLHSDTILPDE